MSKESINLHALFAPASVVDGSPSADLWSRIVAARAKQSRHRRVIGFVGGGLATIVAATVLAFSPWRFMIQPPGAGVDWQARAQALELQLDSLPVPSHVENDHALQTVSDIASVDGDLQSAYDQGASREAILPLWKRRSELLGALLAERRQLPIVTDI